jgi:hypothetical protein
LGVVPSVDKGSLKAAYWAWVKRHHLDRPGWGKLERRLSGKLEEDMRHLGILLFGLLMIGECASPFLLSFSSLHLSRN